MNIKIPIHKRGLETRKNSLNDWKIPDSEKKDVLKFLDDCELGKVNKGKKIGESRLTKYLDLLKVPLEFFNKPTSKVTMKDVENFEKNLSSGKIKSKFKNKPYMESTKVDLRKALKIYFRWKLGPEKALSLTDWLDTREKAKTPDFLTEQEISKLFKKCRDAEQRFLIAVLFDSGARAEEFHNIRYEDLRLPEGKENFVKISLKEEYSKTKGRTISLYWKHSLEAVSDYLQERIKDGIKPDEPIFNKTYEAARRFLHRLGQSVLNKSIHYHLFRHSSATYYANKLNRQELCIRYGWKFSSPMPDVYISRAGVDSKQLDDKFTSTELGDLKTQLEREALERKRLQEKINEMQEADRKHKEKVVKFLDMVENDESNLLNNEAFLRKRLEVLSKGKQATVQRSKVKM